MIITIELVLLVFSILFMLCLLATKAGSKFGIPVLLLFLGIGMLCGLYDFGIDFRNYEVAEAIGTVALCLILSSGGLDTKYKDVKPVAAQGIVLATIGVVLTTLFTGLFIYYVSKFFFPGLGLDLLTSLLMAAVMSSTDSASVFSILRSKSVRLKKKLRPLLELESGSNDPMAYMLTVVLIQLILSAGEGTPSYGAAIGSLFAQLIIGAVAGFLMGKFSVWVINKINLANDSLYPILVLTCSIFIFSAAYFMKGNGYLAVYIGGLVIGNSKVIHKRSSIRFFDGLAWISQMIMFLALGLLIVPSALKSVAWIGIIVGVFMIVGARPLAVFISLLPFRKMKAREKVFISWVGLRGAVPIIFAILPVVAGVPHAELIFDVVFFITLLSLLIQGTFLSNVAKWLGLAVEGEDTTKFEEFDVEFSEEIKSTMTEISLNRHSLSHGSRLMDMPLPDQTLVVMVKRHNQYFIPKGNTELHPGDKLLVITNDENALVETYKNLGIKNYRLRRN